MEAKIAGVPKRLINGFLRLCVERSRPVGLSSVNWNISYREGKKVSGTVVCSGRKKFKQRFLTSFPVTATPGVRATSPLDDRPG
jgi:hypothetical protein